MKNLFRNHLFHASVTQLKEDLVKAQAVTQEANCLSQEMDKETEFVVTLQIPAHNLTPNRKVSKYIEVKLYPSTSFPLWLTKIMYLIGINIY